LARRAFAIDLWAWCRGHHDCDLRLARTAFATSEHFVLVPVCLWEEPVAIGAVEVESFQLATGRRAGDMETMPPPTSQHTVLLLF